jgi:hypothetical protein
MHSYALPQIPICGSGFAPSERHLGVTSPEAVGDLGDLDFALAHKRRAGQRYDRRRDLWIGAGGMVR